MTKKRIYTETGGNEHEYTLTKPENCSMEVTIGRYSVTIYLDELSNKYILDFSDGWSDGRYREKENRVTFAVQTACAMILARLKHEQVSKKLCSDLDDYYDSIPE